MEETTNNLLTFLASNMAALKDEKSENVVKRSTTSLSIQSLFDSDSISFKNTDISKS